MAGSGLYIFGEVLYDVFPDGQQVLGGAPFNVAWHAQAFGLEPHFISRVGNDTQGDRVIAAMRNWGMHLDGLQQDAEHPTGRVQVSLTVANEPTYHIVPDSAWDFIDSTLLPPCGDCRLLYHGTLALRNAVSRGALEVIKRRTPGATFIDVNLRAPWWDREDVIAQLADVRWTKLNHHELELLAQEAVGTEEAIERFMRRYAPELLIVTQGDAGALAVSGTGERAHAVPDRRLAVVDTVGAGDAFASVVLLGIIRRWPLPVMLERAQSFASAIVGQRGATVGDMGFYRPFLEQWGLG
jgi:fructokinase